MWTNSRRAVKGGAPTGVVLNVGHHTLLAFAVVAAHGLASTSARAEIGPMAYSFDTSDNPLPFPYSDFAPGELKAECSSGGPVAGLSASVSGEAHSALCETPLYGGTSFPFNSAAVTEVFSTSDSADFGGRGDWDPGYLKGECAVGNVVNGVAQTLSGQIDHLQCTHYAVGFNSWSADTTCTAHAFPGDYPSPFPYNDWAYGDYKLECDLGTTLVGISADPSAHHPHAILCCTVDQTSWISLVHQPSFVADTALLLTDGTVMVHKYQDVAWYRLTPDAFGNYWTGTWSQLANAPSGYSPTDFASAVLPDGRVIIEGGEYLAGQGPVWTNLGALYDPTRNSWTPITPPSGWTYIGDAESVVLANGTFMLASANPGTSSALFNASTLTWTTTGWGKADSYDEEGWTLLPSGKVLTVDTGNGTNSEIYDPTTGAWASAGSTGVGLVETVHHEIGPGLLLADGRVFVGGATPNTALYGTDGVWRAGPRFPSYAEGQMIMDDACAALLPNGNALLGTSNGDVLGVHFLEFDGTHLFEVARTPNAPNTNSEEEKFLILPSGQVLATDVTGDVEIYYPIPPTTSPSWAPTISSVPATVTRGQTYLIQGTRFNGVSQGMSYGDDAQQATNYPLVRITNNATHHVFYARTHGHSTMGVSTGSTVVSTNFDVPAAAETGASKVVVVANGVASLLKSITVN